MRPDAIIVSGRGNLYPYLQLIVDLEAWRPRDAPAQPSN
jgi:hypothetical protein